MTRIDRIDITMHWYTEFEGQGETTFTYIPTGPEDPFALAVSAKNQERLMAEATGGNIEFM